MRLAGTRSWVMGIDMPRLLLLALYVRDAAGLEPAMDPRVPRLVPEVPPAGPPPAAAAAQLAAWWPALLAGEPAIQWQVQDAGGGQASLQALAAHHMRLAPPFEGLAGSPELRELVAGLHAEASAWAGARGREWRALTTAPKRVHVEGDLVREAERRAGRAARPFRLYVSVVPVAGAVAWRVAEDHVLAGMELYASASDWRRWLEPVIAELA